MTRKYEIADEELYLSCECADYEDTSHQITAIYFENKQKEEIAFCSECGNTRYTRTETNGWEDQDENTFKDAPQSIIEHHENQIKLILNE